MTRLMYDSTNPLDIPTNAQMVAGYVDGTTFKWPESAWGRFPQAVKVRIARRTSTNDGHVLDVETGIPTVWPITDVNIRTGIRNWVSMRRASGIEPTIYCNQLNDWQAIRGIFTSVGMKEPYYWVARYNNVRDIPAGAIAKQFANPPLAGGHFDLSTVADYWPGVDGGNNVSIPTDVWGHTLDFDPNGFPDGEVVPAGGPAWMHMTNANLYATRASAKATDTYNRVVQLTSQYLVFDERLQRIEAMLELLVGDGVRVTAEGTIVIGLQPNQPTE